MNALATALVLACLLVGCASQVVEIKTPLPPDVGNPFPPQRDLPDQLAAFVGVWAGRFDRWDNMLLAGPAGVDQTLIVQNILPLTEDSYTVWVIRSWGIAPGNPKVRPGYFGTSGVIGKDGVLRLVPTPNGAVITATMAEDRQTLHLEFRGIDINTISFRMTGILWRTKLP